MNNKRNHSFALIPLKGVSPLIVESRFRPAFVSVKMAKAIAPTAEGDSLSAVS